MLSTGEARPSFSMAYSLFIQIPGSFERALAAVEHGKHALAFASGMVSYSPTFGQL
jgi:cystathionine beta-lyase/cystathionine gamma-synthase